MRLLFLLVGICAVLARATVFASGDKMAALTCFGLGLGSLVCYFVATVLD
jgi:hypothetical protein